MGASRRDRFDRIEQRVIEAGGVCESTVADLRDAYGAGRTGCHVRDGIDLELRRRNIDHVPRRLPNDQAQVITLFHTGTTAGRVLAGALELAVLSRSESIEEEPAA